MHIHVWWMTTFGQLVIRKCMVCGFTQYRTSDDEEWTDVRP